MTKREAGQLAKRIERESKCTVTGMRRWGRGRYDLTVQDTVNGYSFVVHNAEYWDDRRLVLVAS